MSLPQQMRRPGDDYRASYRCSTGCGYHDGCTWTKAEIHGFADASETAYVAVTYLQTEDEDGGMHVSLLRARTRVAPLQQVSLPRLELCAAALVTHLAEHVWSVLGIPSAPVHLWSDSTVALAWIQGHPSRWRTYVANRVSDIQRVLSEARWHHVRSQDNPADRAS